MAQTIWVKIYTFLIVLSITLALAGFVKLILHRFRKKNPGSTAVINSLRVIMRFVVIFIIAISIFSIFELSSSVLWSISSVSGIIIGFATTEVMSQIISGLYLITTNPFDIEDMVKIGSVEGVVEEINLNHTIIKQFDGTLMKIPNKKMLDAKFMNFTMDTEKIMQTHRGIENRAISTEIEVISPENEVEEKKNGFFTKQTFLKFFGEMSDLLSESKVTQYTFTIELELDLSPQDILQKLDRVCEKYDPLYNFKPKFAVVKLSYRAIFKFWIFCHNPYVIMENHNNFITEIAKTVYVKEEVEE